MSLNFENVCAKLNAKEVGNEWLALCPAHDDRSPSLAIKRGNKQEVVFVCRAGCTQRAVLQAVNARMSGAVREIQKVEQKGWDYSLVQLERAEAELSKAEDFLAGRGIKLETAKELRFGFENGRLVMPTFVDGQLAAVKLRAIAPRGHEDKWRKFNRDRGVYHLFNRDAAVTIDDLWVVESELDAAMLASLGLAAISVDSANHTLTPADTKLLKGTGRVLLALDGDEPGQKCAARFEAAIPYSKRIRMPNGIKDLGELHASDPANFSARLEALREEALNRSPSWREKFHTVDELPEGELKFLVERIIPEGVTFVGSLSGIGKTWFALSLVRALTTGKPFVGVWRVPEPVNVLYLVPEVGGRAFRRRCEKLGIRERFYCQTMKDGVCNLADPLLAAAIRDLEPVVFLDTAIRFTDSGDENSSSQNARGLASDVFTLLNLGATSVVGLHHSPKSSAEKEAMTLENVLRGTGDIGAMCDCVWGLQHDRGGEGEGRDFLEESEALTRLFVKCVKPRDFDPPEPFRIQGRPYIDDKGDFSMLTEGQEPRNDRVASEIDRLIELNPATTKLALAKATGASRNRVEELANEKGWAWRSKGRNSGEWYRTTLQGQEL